MLRRLEQEKMKQDMAVLQRMLEQKERKMQELMRNSGQVPALKQHYDRVLQVRGASGGGEGARGSEVKGCEGGPCRPWCVFR